MGRVEGDDWDVVSGVGRTALIVAAARAMETARPDGLVDDPWAEKFVRASGDTSLPMVPVLPDGGHRERDDPDLLAAIGAGYVGARSRYLDEFVDAACADGLGQTVILAVGLDSRPVRTAWPEGSTVFEVDRDAVITIRDKVLGEAPTRALRRPVVVDLRGTWPAALVAAGFAPDRPTAWIAEGLLPYLPDHTETELLDRIDRLSAPGSRLALDERAAMHQITLDARLDANARRNGFEVAEVAYLDPRTAPGDHLERRGWTVTTRTAGDVARTYGRPLDHPSVAMMAGALFVTARQP